MTLKSDAKFKQKLTFGFRFDMRNFLNFHPTTQKSENFTSMSSISKYKYIRFEPKKNREELYFMKLNSDANFE